MNSILCHQTRNGIKAFQRKAIIKNKDGLLQKDDYKILQTTSSHCLNNVSLFLTGNKKKIMLSHNTMVKQRKQQASAIMKEIHGNGINDNS